MEFYRELFCIIDKEQFLLLYLYSDMLEENIKIIKKKRCDNQGNEVWYQMMMEYLIHSPYGEKHGYGTFEDMIAHFKHRQQLEMRIIKEILGDRSIVLFAKDWKIDEIMMQLRNR